MTFLVAVDFSPCSRAATRLAAALAKRTGERVVLFHAIASSPLDPFANSVDPGGKEEAHDAFAAALSAEAAELRQQGIAVETRIGLGSAANAIVDAAREVGADLIVIGSHGRSGAALFFFGSCAEEVVRTATCPVLVTRDDTTAVDRWTESRPIRLTAVADGSNASASALFWLRISPLATKSDLSIVRLFWPPHESKRYGIEEPWLGLQGHPDLLRLLERDLRRDTVAAADGSEPTIRFRVSEHDDGEGVAEDARQLRADAIVVGIPRHRNASSTGFAIGSFLRGATVPVFCIPERLRPEPWRIPEVQSVLIACDLSDASRAAVAAGYDLLSGGGRAELCCVLSRPVEGTAPLVTVRSPSADERATVEAQLRALIPAQAGDHRIATNVSVISGDDVAESIIAAAERVDADVIVVGSHARSGIERALMGSIAESVERQALRPVLIVRSRAP